MNKEKNKKIIKILNPKNDETSTAHEPYFRFVEHIYLSINDNSFDLLKILYQLRKENLDNWYKDVENKIKNI